METLHEIMIYVYVYLNTYSIYVFLYVHILQNSKVKINLEITQVTPYQLR